MENRRLTHEELVTMRVQYYTLTETIGSYRRNMRGREYRKRFNDRERRLHDRQLKFFTIALQDTLRCLVDHKFTDGELLKHAVRNRHLKLKWRWRCLKELSKQPIVQLL